MANRLVAWVLAVATSLSLAAPVVAAPLTHAECQTVLDGVDKALDHDPFPVAVSKMRSELKQHRTEYLELTDPDALSVRLTEDLRRASGDLHLNVIYEAAQAGAPMPASPEADAIRSAAAAYGFADVRHLPGNVGYLDLRSLSPGPKAEAYVAGAMTLLGQAQALIIDLRKNHGGQPEVVDLLMGRVLGHRELLLRVHEREPDGRFRVEERYSTVPPDGFHFDAPVFVLTSHATFSAGEELAYDLQSLRHAIVVGETSGGGANPGDVFSVAPGFDIFVPTGYVEGAATQSNWEGVGVKPDVPVPADQALVTAYELALKGIAPTNPRASAALTDVAGALKSSVQF